MENAETILVIILSGFLALFLVLAIVLMIKCIQISNNVKRITTKAEKVVDTAGSVGDFFKAASGNFAVGKVISQLVSSVTQHNNRGKDGKHGKE